MKDNTNSTGLIPVTIQLPAEIAERIQKRNYDFQPLFELLDGESFTSDDFAETLLAIYFAFTQIVALHPDAVDMSTWEMNEHLGTLEQLYRAFSRMEPKAEKVSCSSED